MSYNVWSNRETLNMTETEIIERALAILESRANYGPVLDSPAAVRDYLRLSLGGLEHEEFCCVWLDAQHKVLKIERVFRGTLTQTSVYPREVVKLALTHNAAAVIFAHNHPSGSPNPSTADEVLTRVLKDTLALIDVRVLDHFVVTACEIKSFAECGLI